MLNIVSIPKGAIKSNNFVTGATVNSKFQFQKVQLRALRYPTKIQ